MIERTLSRAYTAIDATKDFNEQEFGKHAEILGGLENTLEALNEDANNVQAIHNAGVFTMGNAQFYMAQDNPAMIAKYGATGAFTEGNPALLNYTVNHAKDLYGMIKDKDDIDTLINATQMRKLEKTEVKGGDGKVNEKVSGLNNEYNSFVDLMGLNKHIIETRKEKDEEKSKNNKIQFVQSQSGYSPKWVQSMTNHFASNEKYITAMFGEYAIDINKDLGKIILDKEGKENAKKIKTFSDINFKLHNEAEQKDLHYFTQLKNQAYNAFQRKSTA